MDIFKKMGITVGNNTSLIQESTNKSETDNEIVHTNVIRKGAGLSPRDVLEQQLAKGGIEIRPMTDEEMCDDEDNKKAKAVNEHLKNTHGEEFHSDNDKQVEKLQSEGEVIIHQHENEKPVVIKFKSMSVLDALSDIVKGEKKAKKGALVEWAKEEEAEEEHGGMKKGKDAVGKKISKLVHEGKPQKQAVATALNMEREGRLTSGGGYKHVKKGEEVKMPKKEFVQEHKKLVNVLNSPSRKDDKEEAKEQKKELNAMKSCKKSFSDAMDVLDSLIKSEKEAPKGVSKKEIAKMKDLHENSEGVVEKKKVIPFLKSVGPGGMIFDFGTKTGNPLADQATALLQQNADPVQQANAYYNANSYGEALKQYVQKGEQAYMQEATPYGNVDKEWSKQLNTPMDTQVKEAFEKGQLVDDNSKPAVVNSFNKTELNLGGQVIKATSETDAALIEMMKNSIVEDDGTGMVAEIGGGQGRVAEIS